MCSGVTRRAIEKALLKPLRAYLAQDLGPHLVTLIGTAIDQACAERKAVGAIIGWQVVYDHTLNPASLLKKGGLRLKLRFEETPDLTDLGIYTVGGRPERIDRIARRLYGSERGGTVELLWDANPGLAAQGAFIAPTTVIRVPDRPAAKPVAQQLPWK